MNLIYKLSLAIVFMCPSPAQEMAKNLAENKIQADKMIQASETIKIGATREEVIKILGPAKWVILPEDKNTDGSPILPPGKTLKLVWDTPDCVPIQVLFDGAYKVWGVGGGISLLSFPNSEEPNAANPGDEFLAKDGQRLKLSLLHSEKPQEAEQPGAGQPVPKPANKTPAEVQPPTPTSKDSPR